MYVAEIGFLATWWVGLVAGWFLARITVPHLKRGIAIRRCAEGFAIVFALAVLGGLVGAWLGWRRMQDADLGGWTDYSLLYGGEGSGPLRLGRLHPQRQLRRRACGTHRGARAYAAQAAQGRVVVGGRRLLIMAPHLP